MKLSKVPIQHQCQEGATLISSALRNVVTNNQTPIPRKSQPLHQGTGAELPF